MPREHDWTQLRDRLAQRAPAEDSSEPGKRAAVAAVLRRAAHGPELLFIRRADDPRDPWSGHMAFPGGRKDETDTDLLATALRETREEVGLDLETHGRLLTRLEDIPAVTQRGRMGLVIGCFVFAWEGNDPALALSDEVAETLWLPLHQLTDESLASTFVFEWEGMRHELPCIIIEGRRIWGLTYQMLRMLLADV